MKKRGAIGLRDTLPYAGRDQPGLEEVMDCWHCRKTALGSCRFCGRGLCEDHAQERPYILELYRARDEAPIKALVVEDALHCGICTPRPDPIVLPELD